MKGQLTPEEADAEIARVTALLDKSPTVIHDTMGIDGPRIKPCWRDYGFTAEGAKKADAALGRMMEIVTELGEYDAALMVLREAHFRLHVLPTRTPEFQKEYKEKNG